MQSSEQEKPPVGIIFDSDMGNSIDDALALALLYGFLSKREARVVSISLSKSSVKAAAFCDAVVRFYARAAGDEHRRILPIGLSVGGQAPEDTPMLKAPLSKRNADGAVLYEHQVQKLNDTAEPVVLIRNALTAQHDQNAIVVLAGPATNLAKLLDLPGAKNLILTKVRFLAFAGGAYAGGPPDLSIRTSIPAARKLFAEWPTPIVASGQEVGKALLFPASSIEKDFAWATDHPIVDAYRAYKPMPYDAPTWALAPVLYAVRSEKGYFKLSEPGTIRVLEGGRTKFTPSPGGSHRYLILDPAQKEHIIQTYAEIASAKPVPKAPSTSPKPPEQKKPQPTEPPKPLEAKPPAQ
jgi:Inosine-uridine preferring nucleoside hydrolase